MEMTVNFDTSSMDGLLEGCKNDVKELLEKYPFVEVRIDENKFDESFSVKSVDKLNFVQEMK